MVQTKRDQEYQINNIIKKKTQLVSLPYEVDSEEVLDGYVPDMM